jgi:hypothetical protein
MIDEANKALEERRLQEEFREKMEELVKEYGDRLQTNAIIGELVLIFVKFSGFASCRVWEKMQQEDKTNEN